VFRHKKTKMMYRVVCVDYEFVFVGAVHSAPVTSERMDKVVRECDAVKVKDLEVWHG
jgi:hypothetical protein